MTYPNNRYIYGDRKTLTELNFPAEAWTNAFGKGSGSKIQELQQKVPWLYRGVNVRAHAIAGMPFIIMDSETEEVIDDSENYKNAVGWLPDPSTTLWLTEASLTVSGRAYHWKGINRFKRQTRLQYLLPTTIEPKITRAGLQYFERKIGGKPEPLKVEDVLYFWGRDPFVEIGPPERSAGMAAAAAAGALFNLDTFVSLFFERGAIKATVVSVPAATQPEERARVKGIFRKMFSGVNKAHNIEVTATEDIQTTVIGEGIKELENVELTKEKREDIAVALDVPPAYLFSDSANYATAKEDSKRLHADFAKPESEFIEYGLNAQVFNPIGLTWRFLPHKKEVAQEEEVQRSEAFKNYVAAGIPVEVVLPMLGIDLPEGMTPEQVQVMVDAQLEKEAELGRLRFRQDTGQPIKSVEVEPSEFVKMIETWERHAIKAHKENKAIKGIPGNKAFDHGGVIPRTLAASIGGQLAKAKSPEQIRNIFRHAKAWEDYP